jgi:protocatechuate 3,4-dioxygenase beta subunit
MPAPDLAQPGLAVPSYEDRSLEAGRTYTYAVFAVDAENQMSAGDVTHLTGTRTRVGDVALHPRQEVMLRGRVVDLSGNGVSGARVVVQMATGSAPSDFNSTTVTATTDTNGKYRLSLTPRAGLVYRVAAPGGVGFGPSWSTTLN